VSADEDAAGETAVVAAAAAAVCSLSLCGCTGEDAGLQPVLRSIRDNITITIRAEVKMRNK
jgi:hypothetical protein